MGAEQPAQAPAPGPADLQGFLASLGGGR
jgi:hypothetical protein